MKAVVMAGGDGSRLRPLTVGRPKPLVPLVNKPVLAHILDLLKAHQITEVIITLRFMASTIQDYFDDGSAFGMKLHYVIEDTPLGTAGSVKNAAALLMNEPFLIISGDAVTDFNLTEIIQAHNQRQAKATITLKRVVDPSEFGVVITDSQNRVIQFLEKPGRGEVFSDTVNTGIYILEPDVLDLIPEKVAYDFSLNLFPQMLQTQMPIYGYVADGYWCDVGNIEEYARACADVLYNRAKLTEPIGEHIGGGVWTGKDVEIAPDAQLFGPIYLGNEVKIKRNVRIIGPAVIRDYSVIDNHTLIERSILWRNTYIGENCEIRGAIISRQCSARSKVLVYENAVVGEGCTLGENSIIFSGVKLWPNKEIEAGASVKDSIIWASQGRRSIFGRFGASGVVNVDLTPEFAAKLGAALGATLPKGSYVAVNRDVHRSSRMLKRALVSGLPGSGVNVWDTQSIALPVLRYFVRNQPNTSAAVHVRLSPFDQRVADIRVMDRLGLNLSHAGERNIERSFFRQDFRRAFFNEIGLIDDAYDPVDAYIADFMRQINAKGIRSAAFRMVVDYSHGPTADVLPMILNQLGVDVVPLNARVDETKLAMLEVEFQQNQQRVGKIVSALGADFGIQLDVSGEKLYLVDENGSLLNNIATAALMMELALFAHGNRPTAVITTAAMPNAFETIANWHQSRLVRSPQAINNLSAAANESEVLLVFDGDGHFIFPQFQPVPDGMIAAAKLMEYLAHRKMPLSQVMAYLPTIHRVQGVVACPWEKKGMVMRRLIERFQGYEYEQIDGLKVHLSTEAWVHFSPHPDKPQFTVVAEDNNKAASAEQLTIHIQMLEAFLL